MNRAWRSLANARSDSEDIDTLEYLGQALEKVASATEHMHTGMRSAVQPELHGEADCGETLTERAAG